MQRYGQVPYLWLAIAVLLLAAGPLQASPSAIDASAFVLSPAWQGPFDGDDDDDGPGDWGNGDDETDAPLTSTDGHEKLVGAIYFVWYREGMTRNPGHQESVLGLYESGDPDVMRQHCEWMKSVGIDFVAISYWGYTGMRYRGIQTAIIWQLQDILMEYDMKMCIMLEGVWSAPPGEVLGQIHHRFTQHPSYLTYEDKPVLLPFWRVRRHSFDPADWTPWLEHFYICSDSYSPHSLAHGFGGWRFTMMYIRDRWEEVLERTRLLHEQGDFLFIAPVLPGYDSRHAEKLYPSEKFDTLYIPRNGFRIYDRTWEQALSANPDWITITSWNGFPEWHAIEPSVPEEHFGHQYLERTAYWIDRFKSGDY